MACNSPGGHNKVSYSQFCLFGSRKSRNDSNLLDPSGSISLVAKDSAQALRLSWVMNMHWMEPQWIKDANDMNRMTLTGRVVVTLINLFGHCIKAARSALGMDAECWGLNIAGYRNVFLQVQRNLEKNVSVKIYFESPRCHTSKRILHSASTTEAK